MQKTGNLEPLSKPRLYMRQNAHLLDAEAFTAIPGKEAGHLP
jgi:hypothetical protein